MFGRQRKMISEEMVINHCSPRRLVSVFYFLPFISLLKDNNECYIIHL